MVFTNRRRRRSHRDRAGGKSPRARCLSRQSQRDRCEFGIDTVADSSCWQAWTKGPTSSADIGTLAIPLNEPIGHRIEAPHTFELGGADISFLGPLKTRLDDLKQHWADAATAGDVTRLVGLFREDLDDSVTTSQASACWSRLANARFC